MLGERKPDVISMDPSWHHNYASLGWWGGPPAAAELHYPSIKPELVGLIDALHGIAHEAERRAEYLADRDAYAGRFRLTVEQRAALVALDHKAIVALGTHPLLPFLARMQVDRADKG
jgi:2,3-dihydroxyphenylpropionate 1,2-dioxygenase